MFKPSDIVTCDTLDEPLVVGTINGDKAKCISVDMQFIDIRLSALKEWKEAE